MTHEELVARLTLAIDHDDDANDSTPPADGNATEPDEAVAERVLADLLRYAPGPAPEGAPPSSAGPPPVDRVELAYAAWDRAVRAVMVMLLERCRRYPDEEFDPRGNPIPPELRGQPVDAAIRSLDPDVPTGEVPVEAAACWGSYARLARDHYIDESVIESLRNCAYEYDHARWARPRGAWFGPSAPRRDLRALEYERAKAVAEEFVEYLDALSP
jgi:hypothetical protein